MQKLTKFINMILLGVMTTAIIFVGAFMLMLFSSAEDGLRTTLFNAIYFSSQQHSDGSLMLNFGLYDNFFPVFGIFVGSISLLFILFDYIYRPKHPQGDANHVAKK